ncbi:MAG: hypothetical protein LC105_03310 [Chitinophagales bacterium]|nr:hypothetical protein [Chitinophagales bacterium]
MNVEYIRWYDYILFVIYAFILYAVLVRLLRKTFLFDFKKYFNYFFFLKVIAAFMYVHVYLYYYGYGDTLRFFRFGQYYKDMLFQISNLSFFEWLFMSNDTFKNIISFQIDYSYGFTDTSFLINKISGYLSFLTFNSFLINTLFFSIFSLVGLWYMFIGLYKIFPKLKLEIALSTLFIPSVVFWGSGLMKDTICIGALGIMTYNICNIFFLKGERSFWKLIIHFVSFLICSNVVSSIKIYQLLAFIPGVTIWIFYSYRDKIKSNFIRKSITPFVIAIIGLGIFIGLQVFTENLNKYAVENVVETALNLNAALVNKDAGSSYDLGPIEPSLFGLIKKAPAAINVSLFRPYIWEVNNPVMLLSGVESLIILLISLNIFFKVGFLKIPKRVLGSGMLIFCFTFSIIFGFAVGLSSQNFGSLVRYKIPLLPLYLIGLFVFYNMEFNQSYFKRFKKNSK